VVGRSLSLEEGLDGARLTAAGEGAPALVRPLMVAMRWPGRRPPARVHVRLDGRESSLDVEALADGLGRVVLPHHEGRTPRWKRVGPLTGTGERGRLW